MLLLFLFYLLVCFFGLFLQTVDLLDQWKLRWPLDLIIFISYQCWRFYERSFTNCLWCLGSFFTVPILSELRALSQESVTPVSPCILHNCLGLSHLVLVLFKKQFHLPAFLLVNGFFILRRDSEQVEELLRGLMRNYLLLQLWLLAQLLCFLLLQACNGSCKLFNFGLDLTDLILCLLRFSR